MDFTLTPEQIFLQRSCREFAEKEILPFVDKLEEDLAGRKALFERMAKMGFFLLSVPRIHGGHSNGSIAYCSALMEVAKADAGVAVAMAVTNMVAEAISNFGTEEQRKKYLSGIYKGECVPASFAITEKQAGSDAKNIKMKASLDPSNQQYILDGEKQFITNADIAGVVLVFAKTAETKEGSSSGEGITAFLVDRDNPGMKVTKKERKLGLLTANLVSLRFERCKVPASMVLGRVGEGFNIALGALDSGRIGIAAQAAGISEAAFDAARKFAKERNQFGHSIGENQAIAFKLADMKVKLEASKLLVYKAAWMKDQGLNYGAEASAAKLFCSESCNEIASEAIQIHGGYGYIKDYPAEKYFRDARVTTLYEGTSEIQRIVISRHLLHD